MNGETKNPPPSVVTADEAISLIDDNTPIPLVSLPFEQENRKTNSNMLLTRKLVIQHRLMRWCALILSIGTIILVWHYLSILILACWLSTICRPLLEWLVNHL